MYDACIRGVLCWTEVDGVIRFDLYNEVFYFDSFPVNVQIMNREFGYSLTTRITEMNDSIEL